MPANAPHGTTSEYSTYSAEAISRVIMVKEFISNHVIVVIIHGDPFHHAVAIPKPFLISSELISVIAVLVCWKRVFSGKLTHECLCTFSPTSKQYQYCLV